MKFISTLQSNVDKKHKTPINYAESSNIVKKCTKVFVLCEAHIITKWENYVETRVYKISYLVNDGLREAEDEAVGSNTDFSNSACSMSGRIGLVFFLLYFEIHVTPLTYLFNYC